jgi:putative peptidoglycan lipid II flippase
VSNPSRAILALISAKSSPSKENYQIIRSATHHKAMTHISRSALIIAIFFGLEKLLGFVRQLIIARQFGLSAELDAFNAANNLPDLIFALVSGGALAIALIPVLSEYLETKGRPVMWDLFSRIANLVFLVTAGLSLVIAIFANQFVSYRLGIVPGFEPAQQGLVADLMRLNLIATLIFSISGLVIAGLQANQHFLLPALARSMYDVGTLIGVVFLAPETGYQIGPITLPSFGLGVYGLVYGTIIGAVLFLGIQIPGLIRYKFRWTLKINLHHPGVRQVLRVLGPRIGTLFFVYLVLIYIPDNIASRLPEGSVTALVYGWLIMQVPETLIGTAIGTAMLPTLSEQFARGEGSTFAVSVNRTIRVILAFTLPLTVLLALTIPPVVGIFGFEESGTDMVIWTARAFLIGLAGHALLEIGARGFYAQQNAITPLWASALMAVLFTALAIIFSRSLSTPGIALANAVAFTGEALILLFLINRKFPGVLQVGKTLMRVLTACVVSGLLVYFLVNLTLPIHPLFTAVGALILGVVVTIPLIWPELKLFLRL